MQNRLAGQNSPYLLQHAQNPVEWYPWGPEALERARREDKPILLSIGYAACHWCHVMAHESFEDPETARLMNDLFVNVKVDREERPDLDAIYMQAVQAMTGHGGWPLTAFLTPDQVPFFTGTYFPKEDRYGMPSFRRVLIGVAEAYRDRRPEVARTAASVRELFVEASGGAATAAPETLTPSLIDRACERLASGYDAKHGGFGGAPKFPQAMSLELLLTHWAHTGADQSLDIALHSFRRMARGGMYDQLGGGFARYSVDAEWLVPHFEKMLYDNALLARLGVHLWQATRDEEVRRVVEETLDWAVREMTSPEGGFHSSFDADSEGHEGKFYLWDVAQLDAELGTDAPLVKAYWGVTPEGNFEGRNILSVPHEPEHVAATFGVTSDHLRAVVAQARRTLYLARAKRVWPAKDDKILTSWNGLMIRAFSEAARAFQRADYGAAAVRAAELLFRVSVSQEGRRVWRSYREGRALVDGFLEDYASLGLAALALYELTFDGTWLRRARSLADAMLGSFWDGGEREGAFYDTARDHEELLTRPRDVTDNATPSGTSLAAELLLRLGEIGDDSRLRARSSTVVEALVAPMARHPMAFGHLLGVADMLIGGDAELALAGDPTARDFRALAQTAGEEYVPALVVAGGPPREDEPVALLQHRPMVDGRSTAYLCRRYTCEEPVTSAEALRDQLRAARRRWR